MKQDSCDLIFMKVLFALMMALIIASIIILTGCQKEEAHNWQFDQLMLVYRSKCGPDYDTIYRSADAITSREMDDTINKYTYEKWVKKSELMFIQIYHVLELADSTWVKSRIIKCGYCVN